MASIRKGQAIAVGTIILATVIAFFVSQHSPAPKTVAQNAPVTPATTSPVAPNTTSVAAVNSTNNSSNMSPTPKPATPKPTATPQPTTPPPSQPPQTLPVPPKSSESVCNTALIGANGYDSSFIISKEACDLLNQLYVQGKAAGNVGDTYENRDGLHVNFCDGWNPVPECPAANRLFPQHSWKFLGGVGKATGVASGITIGQASYAGFTTGDAKFSIPHAFYETQTGASQLYQQYTHNNLYIYPALDDDAAPGTPNIANTPYVIASRQIAKAGTDYYHVHGASGSEFPFIKLAMAGLAALKPDVKAALSRSQLLMPTIQMLIRQSHTGGNNDTSSFMAHSLVNGAPHPLYDSAKLVRTANALTLADIPPLVQMTVTNENFTDSEKLFTTPGAIARSVAYGTTRKITVSAVGSVDLDDTTTGHTFQWRVLQGDTARIKIMPNQANPAEATIEFTGGTQTERLDVGVFVKKSNGTYESVPGLVTMYVHG